jgi:adenine-specific DNA-methyltransferase
MPRPPSNGAAPITSHTHATSARLNIPEATEAKARLPRDKKPTYRYSPHLTPKLQFDPTGSWDRVTALIEKAIAGETLTADEAAILRAAVQQGGQPWLEWAAKQEQEGRGSFNVDNVILHVHERVSAKAIIAAVQREESETQDLFARPKLHREQSLQYYRHNVDWANRLILGDSLQVMSSLAVRENLAGKVQMIYIDPPYGIKFSSNWQNEVGKRDVKDKDEDLTREPEMIKAYRDTWTLGVHSYLAYLKQRLIVSKDLLTDSGSIFVQISDEQLHRVRAVLDEVFGPQNFVSLISFAKTSGFSSTGLSNVADYLLWYAKDRAAIRYRQLYSSKRPGESGATQYGYIESKDEDHPVALTKDREESLRASPQSFRVLTHGDLASQGVGENTAEPFSWRGMLFTIAANSHWKTTPLGLLNLSKSGRLMHLGASLRYKRYLEDFPVFPQSNVWGDTGVSGFSDKKAYVVQTNTLVITRCMLMTTDPGDLVLDPTCGSGTTALVAEQWGRRWITIDSSRVALSIARQRLLTASFDAYKTKDPNAGVDPTAPQNPAYGFHYKTVPHITLKSIAQNRNLDPIFTKHEPLLDSALERLNSVFSCLAESGAILHVDLVAKLRTKVVADGNRSVSDADLRRWLLPGTSPALLTFGTAKQRASWKESIPAGPGWKEWEVPFDTDPDWPKELSEALLAYRHAWRSKMDEVNTCIAQSADQEELVDQPEVVRGVSRVSGPFSVEGVRPEELALGEDGKLFDPTANEFDDSGSANADSYIDLMVNLLRKDGVTFLGNRRAEFASLEKEAGKSFHARGRWKGKEDGADSVAVVFGPQYGPINAPMGVQAIEEARGLKEITDLVLAGFSFDAAAQEKAKEKDSPAFRIHLAHIRPDVSPGMQGLLKETPNSQLFTVFGQPEIQVLPADDGEYKVQMDGVCVYNPLTGEISDTANTKVAAWFLDTDYDGRCFCISQAFFPDKAAWEKIAKALGSSVPDGAFEAFTTSWPFKPGQHKRIAVKVIDPRGNEVMAIKTLIR